MKLVFLSAAAGCLFPAVLRADTVSFEDLTSPPALDSGTGLQYTTGGTDGSFYAGVVWDPRVEVVGDEYKIATTAPLFGLPHSGHYFITNQSGDDGNGITMDTTLLLSGAWFGRNEYYGFGGGADSITISALSGPITLASVTFPLPDNFPGEPEPLSFVDTSEFLGLTGITGYRIDHTAPGPTRDSWIADDFQFVNPVPEPAAATTALAGLFILGYTAGHRRPKAAET